MPEKTYYINTDLQLISVADLTPLVAALESVGMIHLYDGCGEDSLWRATLETAEPFHDPESNITAMLNIVESLGPGLLTMWSDCKLREFDIGYNCGDEPRHIVHDLGAGLISRLADFRASLRLTFYSYGDQEEELPQPLGQAY